MNKAPKHFTDGGLIEEFREGNRGAICAVSAIAGKLLNNHGEFHDRDLIDLFANVLSRIGNGESPNDAFGWKQKSRGRMVENLAMRDWDVKQTVLNLMRDQNLNLSQACARVCSEKNGEFLLGKKIIDQICKGLSTNTSLELPESPFPFDQRFPWRKKSNPDLDRFET